MALRRSAVLTTLLSAALASTLTAAAAATAAPAAGRTAAAANQVSAAGAATTGFRAVDITARDGVVLKANVIAPTTAGLHPAIVFINSWGLSDAEYLVQASAFAQRGYVVLSYTTRGFWG